MQINTSIALIIGLVKGRPVSNANEVMSIPSSPASHAPVITIHNPVIIHIITVPIKVDVIEIRPCLVASFDFAVAIAIGALPSPASFFYSITNSYSNYPRNSSTASKCHFNYFNKSTRNTCYVGKYNC